MVDVRLMDIGLKGDDHTDCTICQSALEETDQKLVVLPCLHVFHDDCIVKYLDSNLGRRNWNCPTCRQHVPENMATYRVNYDAQLENRFVEVLLSGFCAHCIIWNMERIRNVPLPDTVNGDGESVPAGLVGQTQDQMYVRRS